MQDAFAKRREAIEQQGILDLNEFRGFALSNEYAPLIFINSKDTDAARSFTLLHELAHIAIGKSGLSNDLYEHQVEQWCNKVAAEVLIPKDSLQRNYEEGEKG